MVTSEICSQSQLEPARLAAGKDSPKERAEIGVLSRDAPVRVIQNVERLHPKLKSCPFGQPEVAAESQIDGLDPGARKCVSTCISEGVRCRVGERGGVKPVLEGPLAGRQVYADSRHHVRAVGRAGVRKISAEVYGIKRRAILESNDP